MTWEEAVERSLARSEEKVGVEEKERERGRPEVDMVWVLVWVRYGSEVDVLFYGSTIDFWKIGMFI